jgi:hypothetical protein
MTHRAEDANGKQQGGGEAAPAPAAARTSPNRPPTLFRRFVLVQLLLVWQGGFLFYTAFVVPVGTEVFGSAARQGAVTARVTDVLNVLGVIGLAAAAWELNYGRDLDPRRTAIRWWCWGIAFTCQCLLFYLHQLLVAFMDPTRMAVVIHAPFYPVHRAYLWASTLQWFACVVFAALTLAAWRAEDRWE